MGNSLGGTLSAFLSMRLFGHFRFKGLVMLAPALDFKVPSPVVVGLLEMTYATFAPNDEMPDWIMKPKEPQAITWREEAVQQQVDQGSHIYIPLIYLQLRLYPCIDLRQISGGIQER